MFSLRAGARCLAADRGNDLHRLVVGQFAEREHRCIGEARAQQIGKRLARQTAESAPLDTPAKVHAFMGPLLQNLPRESLRVLLLDTRHRLLHEEEVSLGTLNESLAHPREILRPAISHRAYAFVLVHNHPSGDPSPSEADRALTRRIRDASELMQIHLLDHVIIGRERPGAPPYFSFKEHGLL